MRKARINFKKGAASFYIVAFSTLILVVIAASFTTVVLSEMMKSENDELSQSAYDAALAGVEDAKVAFLNYQKCKNGEGTGISGLSCADIYRLMKSDECGMVAKILGRNTTGEEVLIEERKSEASGISNNMQQAYTCTTIKTDLDDYVATLTEDSPTRVVKVRLADIPASSIEKVKLSWYATKDYSSVSGSKYSFSNFGSKGKVEFPKLRKGDSDDKIAVPPMLSVGLVQTPSSYSLDDFERTDGGTNRGTVFLIPTDREDWAQGADEDNYKGIWNGDRNVVEKARIIKSNNRAVKNVPLGVYCKDAADATADYACEAWLELPEVAGGGKRIDSTFMFVVSLVYGQPSTSFSLSFYCGEESACGSDEESGNKATLSGMQAEVDSTGRANNLYRRIATRLESADTYFPFPLFAIDLLGDGGDGGNLLKPDDVVCEWEPTFGGPTC